MPLSMYGSAKRKQPSTWCTTPPETNLELSRRSQSRDTPSSLVTSTPHTDWGYNRTTETGRAVAEFICSNAVLLLEDEDEENRATFLSNSGHTPRPDLVMAHSLTAQDLCTENLDCPSGLGHKIIKVRQIDEGDSGEPPHRSRNFKKANWDAFSCQLENTAETCNLTGNPHQDAIKLEEMIKSAAYRHIPRGQAKFYRPFWNERLDQLRGIRNKCRKTAEAQNQTPIKSD